MMRQLVALAVVVTIAGPVTCQPIATTADVAFLTGCWKVERNGRTIEEHWMAPAGGSLLGVSRTVTDGKLTEFEFVQIRDLPEGLMYIARPSGQPETSFKATSRTATEIVFENPAHDFPQKIRYRSAGATLDARVEGVVNGKTRGIDFLYTRTPCAP